MKLENKTILITGGTSGIGYQLGLALLKKRNRVILLGRSKAKLSEAQNQGFDTIQCDITNLKDLEATVLEIQNRYTQLDVVFNNAGIQENYYFTESVIPLDKINREIDVNLSSQIVFTHLILPVLSNSDSALIVNTTSGLGAYPKNDGLVYSASKAGFRSFTTGLRNTLKGSSIQVVEFIPPVTDTGMTAGRSESKVTPEKLVESIIPQIEKGKKLVTVPAIRIFLWISFLFPSLAFKILSKS